LAAGLQFCLVDDVVACWRAGHVDADVGAEVAGARRKKTFFHLCVFTAMQMQESEIQRLHFSLE
jgi:hypothetical protein